MSPLPSEWLTVQEVARLLRVDPSTVRRWISQGCLSARVLPHPGNRKVYRIDRDLLDALLLPVTPHLPTPGEDSLLSSPSHAITLHGVPDHFAGFLGLKAEEACCSDLRKPCAPTSLLVRVAPHALILTDSTGGATRKEERCL